MNILYAIGDSNVWGAELKNIEDDRLTKLLADKMNLIEFNTATTGISNDRIYRVCIRDTIRFLNGEKVWCESLGNITVKDIFVLVGWTSPTRFEYIDHKTGIYNQKRNWDGDRWGFPDEKKKLEESELVLNFTDIRYSYVKIFNQLITLHHFLKSNNIRHLFYNSFWNWDIELNKKILETIDKSLEERQTDIENLEYDYPENYYSLIQLWDKVPKMYKDLNQFKFLKSLGNDYFYERGHPTEDGHKEWANVVYKYIEDNKI